MDFLLEILASYPGPWAFGLLLACGLGLPPWSEEIVILGSGFFVAQGELGYWEAIGWCYGGILAGDSIIYVLGKWAGESVYRWPVLRRHMKPRHQARFARAFARHGNLVVFLARFIPGFRMMAYFTAGNLGMPYWRFTLLDSIGAALTVPISVWLGSFFADNLDRAIALLHEFQIPLILTGGAAVFAFVLYRIRRRRKRFLDLRRRRRKREQIGPSGDPVVPETAESKSANPVWQEVESGSPPRRPDGVASRR